MPLIDFPKEPYAPLFYAHRLQTGQSVQLGDQICRGLQFRKVNVKEAFTLADIDGQYFRASLQSLNTTTATALVYEHMVHAPESSLRIFLACSVLQRQRMLMVAQKGAELGMERLLPVFTSRSVDSKGLAHEKVHAWPGQALKGSRQCRRGSVPQVHDCVSLKKLLASSLWKDASLRIFLDDRVTDGVVEQLSLLKEKPLQERTVLLMVGPEGGFADEECSSLREHGALALRLGGRVLRAETAVFAGLTAMQLLAGDMGASSC